MTTIVLFSDDELVRRALERLAAERGMAMRCASSLDQCEAAARSEPAALVVDQSFYERHAAEARFRALLDRLRDLGLGIAFLGDGSVPNPYREAGGGCAAVERGGGRVGSFLDGVAKGKAERDLSSAPDSARDIAAPQQEFAGSRVFVADDSSTVRAYVEYILREKGFRVTCFVNGKEMVDALRASGDPCDPCDIILLDSEMPVMDGITTLRELKSDAALRGLPVLFLSAQVEKERIVVALRAGAEDYIAKPFQVDELLARISVHLKIRRMQSEIVEQRDDLSDALGELTKSNRLLLKMFDIIAHDLRGPIGNFSTFLGMLLDSGEETSREELLEVLGTLRDSSLGVFSLLENLLSWSRCQRGEMGFDLRDHDLVPIVDQAASVLATTAANKRISVSREGLASCPAHCDQFAISTVVRNLLSNSLKFTPEGGAIRVALARKDGGVVEVAVADNGVGIAPENIPKLFNAYEHFTTWGTNKEKGTGLGLDLCHQFVERNGGRIWVESEVGAGTTFRFTLPAAAEG